MDAKCPRTVMDLVYQVNLSLLHLFDKLNRVLVPSVSKQNYDKAQLNLKNGQENTKSLCLKGNPASLCCPKAGCNGAHGHSLPRDGSAEHSTALGACKIQPTLVRAGVVELCTTLHVIKQQRFFNQWFNCNRYTTPKNFH